MAGLYLHIPFCKQACYYCDFHFSTDDHHILELCNAMAGELALQKNYLTGHVQTLYFGGGTPSLLSGAFMMWFKLSLLILVLLASKLFIVLLFSSLFNFTETISFQFFNFLRFVLFTAVVMAISSLVYFVFKGGQRKFKPHHESPVQGMDIHEFGNQKKRIVKIKYYG